MLLKLKRGFETIYYQVCIESVEGAKEELNRENEEEVKNYNRIFLTSVYLSSYRRREIYQRKE
jgi:hypothetical protein